jgi:hypothetical protein
MTKMTALRESTQQAPSRAWMNHGRIRSEGRVAVVNPLLRLQQSVGNQAVGRMIQATRGWRLQRQLGSAPVAQTVIRSGASGPMVAELQRRLNQAGADPVLEVDGVFGGHTRGAVIVFQQRHGLVADGIVGPQTWTALGGSPTNRSETSGSVTTGGESFGSVTTGGKSFGSGTTGGEFEEARGTDSAFQETVGPGVESFAVDPKECFEQNDACHACCEKLHPWWDPREWSARKSCKTDCCDWAFRECMSSGNFPCVCKSPK